MSPGLLLQAFPRIEQHDRRIRTGRAGDHVLEKFLVAGRIDDDVTPPLRAELNLRGVDGDVLLLLFQQRIEQKGVFKFHALGVARLLNLLNLPVRQ